VKIKRTVYSIEKQKVEAEMAHAIRIMPESKEAQAILEAERQHNEVLEIAVTNLVGTMPRFFKTVKQGLKHSDSEGAYRDLGEQQLGLLYALAKEKQLTSELARTFNVAMPTITRSVDTLVERGYVERQPDPTDRRCIYLQLTDKGMMVNDHAHAQFRSAVSRFLSPLDEEQLRDVARACDHMAQLLPGGLYDYEGVCPTKPSTPEEMGKQAAKASGEIGAANIQGLTN
jgi:DNA-binding MarR family transcriptional regulator